MVHGKLDINHVARFMCCSVQQTGAPVSASDKCKNGDSYLNRNKNEYAHGGFPLAFDY